MQHTKTFKALKVDNHYDALVAALTLAIQAPTEELARQVVEVAESIANDGMSEHEVMRAKREAEAATL
jgi:hypothetical protein